MGKKISIDKTMQDIVYIKNQIDGLTLLLNNKKNIMAKYFEKSGKRSIENDNASVYISERTKVNYDVDKILSKLPKEVTSKFIKTTYTIPDWSGFYKYLKRHGIDGPSIKPYISLQKEVDEGPLNYMYEHNLITLDDLDGCYDATVTKSITLRVKNTSNEVKIKDANPK